MAEHLAGLVGKEVLVLTNDGRIIVGLLRGYDQMVNMILEDCREREFSEDAGMNEVPLGLYLLRGDNVAVIGEMDASKESETDWESVRAGALKPVTH